MHIAQRLREAGNDAIRTKIRDGKWHKHFVWGKASDGRTSIGVEEYYSWIEMEEVSASQANDSFD